MPRQFKNARLIKHLKVADAIKLLGVSQPTLSAWEGERKSPSIEKLELMADIYETSTDYLLGRIRIHKNVPSNPISLSCLPVLHEQPLWSPEYGWMLVNSIEKHLCPVRRKNNSIFHCRQPLYDPTHFFRTRNATRSTIDTDTDACE